jgi:hypothetical protein
MLPILRTKYRSCVPKLCPARALLPLLASLAEHKINNLRAFSGHMKNKSPSPHQILRDLAITSWTLFS